MEEYQVKFYTNSRTKEVILVDYLNKLPDKIRAKLLKYIEFLRGRDGYLDEPYSKHITGKIRELRVDFGKSRHRIFYFVMIGKKIILLHAFVKNTVKTPPSEINIALANYLDVINNKELYE